MQQDPQHRTIFLKGSLGVELRLLGLRALASAASNASGSASFSHHGPENHSVFSTRRKYWFTSACSESGCRLGDPKNASSDCDAPMVHADQSVSKCPNQRADPRKSRAPKSVQSGPKRPSCCSDSSIFDSEALEHSPIAEMYSNALHVLPFDGQRC